MGKEKFNPFLQGIKLSKYILKNISKYDIFLNDLGYTIPLGQSRNLLGKTAYLKYEDIQKSRASGSIFKKLNKFLIEINAIVPLSPPLKKEAAKVETIIFPQRTKSSIIIDVDDVISDTEVIQNEEDELLKQLEQEYEENVVPIVANEKKEKT